MKHKFLTVLLALVATICLCFGLAACGGGGYGTEGTYYLVENDKYDTQTYFTLKGGKWTDEDGATGDYEIDGEKITFYTDFFGERIELTDGTLKDGILTVRDPGGNTVYAQEGAWKGAGGSQGGSEGGGQSPSAKEYTVTYDANGGAFAGGDETFTQSVKEGAKLTAPASPARSNYSFAGWAKSKNGSEMWKFDEDAVSGNTTLYAQWTQESAVILSVEGASIEGREIFMLVDHATSTVSLSGKIVCSDDSIWRLYSDPEGQREIPTKMVTNLNSGKNTYYIVVNSQNQAQVNVYELTVHRSYLVTVSYYNGDALLKTEEVYTGDTFTASYTPDITGYTFNKWKTLGGEEFTSDVIWGTTALYADKTANTYKATLNVNGGDALTETEKTMTYDEEYTFPVPRRTGYSFAGWYVGSTQITNANGGSLSAWRYASAQNVTAHWQANDYAVTLKQNDENAGSVSGGGDHAYDSQVTITATTNKGYNFLGWYDKDGELVSDKAQYTFKMGFAVSYTAKWDYYTVTATRNNTSAGTLSKYYNAEKVSVGTKVTLTANTNKGYTFVGWYKGDEEVSKALSYQFTMGKENVSYEARWIVCPVKAQSGDETAGTVKGLPDTTVLGQEVTLTATTNKGYTFVGWYKGDEEVSTELSYQITIGKENVIYEARWCKVTLRSANTSAGSVDSLDSTYKVGDEVTITAETNKGYTFVGWYKDDEEVSTELSYQITMGKEDVTYEARWCKVTLRSANTSAGSVGSLDSTYKVGDEVTLTATTNKGYTFVGWYKDDEEVSTELSYQITMGKEDVTYEARWCKVTLRSADTSAGSVGSLNSTYKVGDKVTITATTNKGYTFVGWYKGDEEVSAELSYQITMGKEDVTYEARWTYYTLTTTINNRDAGSLQQTYNNTKVTAGEQVTLVAATTNVGYTFVGWYKGEEEVSTGLSCQITMGKENVTYEARWELVAGMEKFNFTSTPTTCTITGLKDTTVTEIIIPDFVTSIRDSVFNRIRDTAKNQKILLKQSLSRA